MKDKDASLEQWQTLVALTQKMIAMEPWKQFEDMEIFALKIPDSKDLIYSSIMGFHEMCYGITFYKGDEGFIDISTIAYEVEDKRFENFVTMESSFLSVYFDDQENVSWQQKTMFKKLGLHANEYPHYTVKEKGCFPDDPDYKEVNDYIVYLSGLIEAIEYFLKNEVIIDFSKQMFLFDLENKQGVCPPLVLTPREYTPVIPNDSEYLNTLKELDCNGDNWELEYNYINQGMERDDGRIVNVRFSMVASVNEGTMLSCIPLKEESDEVEVVLDSLFQLIERYGRPLSICINNVRMLPLIGPSCEYLNIELDEVDELEIVDVFLAGFYEYAASQEMA